MKEILNNQERAEILIEKLKKLKYGDIISHKQISKLIQETYPSNRYTTTLTKARKILIKQGICLESVIGYGYKIIEPDSFVEHSLKHYKRGFNEIQKGYNTLTYAPTKDMTPEGRIAYRRVHDRAITLNAAMKGAKVELKTLSEKQHPMAVENVNR